MASPRGGVPPYRNSLAVPSRRSTFFSKWSLGLGRSSLETTTPEEMSQNWFIMQPLGWRAKFVKQIDERDVQQSQAYAHYMSMHKNDDEPEEVIDPSTLNERIQQLEFFLFQKTGASRRQIRAMACLLFSVILILIVAIVIIALLLNGGGASLNTRCEDTFVLSDMASVNDLFNTKECTTISGLTITDFSSMTSQTLVLDRLVVVTGSLTVQSAMLGALVLPNLQRIGDQLSIIDNTLMTHFNVSADLTHVNTAIIVTENPFLVDVTFSGLTTTGTMTLVDLSTLSTIAFPALTSATFVTLEDLPRVLHVDFPLLRTLTNLNIISVGGTESPIPNTVASNADASVLISIEFPLLNYVTGDVSIRSVNDIRIIDFRSLTHTDTFSVQNCFFSGALFALQTCESQINLSSLNDTDDISIRFTANLHYLCFNLLTKLNALTIDTNTRLLEATFPSLVSSDAIDILFNSDLTALNVPLLQRAWRQFRFIANSKVQNITLPALTKTVLLVVDNPVLSSVDAPKYRVGSLVVYRNGALKNLSFPKYASCAVTVIGENNVLESLSFPRLQACSGDGWLLNSQPLSLYTYLQGSVYSQLFNESDTFFLQYLLSFGTFSVTSNPALTSVSMPLFTHSVEVIFDNCPLLCVPTSMFQIAVSVTIFWCGCSISNTLAAPGCASSALDIAPCIRVDAVCDLFIKFIEPLGS